MKALLLTLFALAPLPSLARPVTVPIDIGVGPTSLTWTGAIAEDQPIHYGLSISAAAVLDKAFLRKNRKLIPKNFRRQVLQMDEIRIGHFLIPDTILISPKIGNTGMYGVTWSPVTLAVPLSKGAFKLDANADAILTYTYIDSDLDTIGTTHFLRPGLGLGANLEFPLGGPFRFSVSWRSNLYVPQKLGGSLEDLSALEEGDFSDSVWHVGQGSAKLHYRFPFTTNL